MSVQVSVSTDVAAPAEHVWAAVTDWAHQGDWIPGTVVVVTDGDGQTVGSRLQAFTGVGDIGFLDTMQIIEWDPPRRCRVRHLGRLMRGTGDFVVEPRGATATFTWSEQLEPPFGLLGRVGLPLARPVLRRGMRRASRAFADECARRWTEQTR